MIPRLGGLATGGPPVVSAGRPDAMSHEITDFQRDVIERSRSIPVLVDFWAPWCGPCRVLGPTLERLAESQRDRWVLAKVNTEVHVEEARRYGVQSIPNVKLFVDGAPVNEFVGALPEAMVQQWLKKALPSKNSARVKEARVLLHDLKYAQAREVLEPIVAGEPDNDRAKALLAKALFFSEPDRARAMADSVDHGPENHEIAEAIRVFHALGRDVTSGHVPDAAVKPLFLEAAADLLAGRFDHALAKFTEVIREDRYYHDDTARKACIAIFKFLGEDHPITLNRRREFNRSLFR